MRIGWAKGMETIAGCKRFAQPIQGALADPPQNAILRLRAKS
jgi:hypothetical protein